MRTRVVCLYVLIIAVTSQASAGPITVRPADLAFGSTYYLAFVTQGTRDATSHDLAFYDAFVTCEARGGPQCAGHQPPNAALAALDTTWRVIGSTALEDARTHVPMDGPIYNLAGNLVMPAAPAGLSALFDVFLPVNPLSLIHSIAIDQFGESQSGSHVWTGTTSTGSASAYPLGGVLCSVVDDPYGLCVSIGQIGCIDKCWLGYSSFSGAPALDGSATENHLYAISGPIVVTPEPGTVLLMVAPLAWRLSRRSPPARP